MLINKIKNKLISESEKIFGSKENRIVNKLIQGETTPIYHVHIRKTAGTTINFAFLSNANSSNTVKFYDTIAKKGNHRQIMNGKVFVGWNSKLINEGRYSYAISHTPLHQLNLSPDIFKFTCLRDPVKRVISNYNMLRYFEKNKIKHPCMLTVGKWLGDSFAEFVTNLPYEHLINQVYMFSKKFSIQEASERLLSLDAILYTERLNEGLGKLSSSTGWDLPVSNQKSYGFKEEINSNDINLVKERLILEYDLLDIIKKEQNKG